MALGQALVLTLPLAGPMAGWLRLLLIKLSRRRAAAQNWIAGADGFPLLSGLPMAAGLR